MFSVSDIFSTLSCHLLYLLAFPVWSGESNDRTKITWSFLESSGLWWFLLWIFRDDVCVLWTVASLAWQETPGLSPPGLNHNFWNVWLPANWFISRPLPSPPVLVMAWLRWYLVLSDHLSLRNLEEFILYPTLIVKKKRALLWAFQYSCCV